jgi:hypothetical protein
LWHGDSKHIFESKSYKNFLRKESSSNFSRILRNFKNCNMLTGICALFSAFVLVILIIFISKRNERRTGEGPKREGNGKERDGRLGRDDERQDRDRRVTGEGQGRDRRGAGERQERDRRRTGEGQERDRRGTGEGQERDRKRAREGQERTGEGQGTDR